MATTEHYTKRPSNCGVLCAYTVPRSMKPNEGTSACLPLVSKMYPMAYHLQGQAKFPNNEALVLFFKKIQLSLVTLLATLSWRKKGLPKW